VTEFGAAWLSLAIAFGLHVADEAAHDFLSWYNPVARSIRQRLAGIPFPPVFTFWPWLLGLLVVTSGAVLLTPYAIARRPWMRPLALGFAAINVGNGLLHIVGAVRLRRRVPGMLSAPLLLGTAAWLLWTAFRWQ